MHRGAHGLGQRGAGRGALGRVGGAVGGSMLLRQGGASGGALGSVGGAASGLVLLGQNGTGGGASLTAFISLLGSCCRMLHCKQSKAFPLGSGALSVALGELFGRKTRQLHRKPRHSSSCFF